MTKPTTPKIVQPSEITDEFKAIIGTKPVEYFIGDAVADQHIATRKGQLNIILGHPSVGKTTWIIWYLYTLAKRYELKTMLYSGENDCIEIYTQLVQLHSGKKYWETTEQEHENAAYFIHQYFIFIDDKEIYTSEQLLDRFDDQNKCDFCVIDPHNSVKVPDGRNWYQYSVELGMELRSFAKRTKKTIFICAHPNTEAQRMVHKDGDFEGMLKPPIGPNIEGGGTWKNKCDNFWIIHRYTNSDDHYTKTHVIVEKVRYQNTGVKPTMLDFPVVFKREESGEFRMN